MRIVQRGDDQVLQHLDIVFGHDLRIDLQRLHLLGAVDDHGDHAAAGVAFDAQVGHLFLQALLHLLRLLHHLLNVHISSTSRISAGKTSSMVCTAVSASAFSRSADFLSTCFCADAGAPSLGDAGRSDAGAAPASASSAVTEMGRPNASFAVDSSHGRCCSNWSRSARWFAENLKVTRSPATSIFWACATTML